MPPSPASAEQRLVAGMQLLQEHASTALKYLNARVGRNAVMHFCDVLCGAIASAVVLAASRSAMALGNNLSLESRGAVAGILRAGARHAGSKPPLSGFTCSLLGRLCRAGEDAARKAMAATAGSRGGGSAAQGLDDASASLAQRSEGYRRLKVLEGLLDRARQGHTRVVEWLAGRAGASAAVESQHFTAREAAMALADAVRSPGGGAQRLRSMFTESEVAALLAAACPTGVGASGGSDKGSSDGAAGSEGKGVGASGDEDSDDLRPVEIFTEGSEWKLPA